MKKVQLEVNEVNRSAVWFPTNVKNFIETNYAQKATTTEKIFIKKLSNATDAEINYALKGVGKKTALNKANFDNSGDVTKCLLLLNGVDFKYGKKVFSKNQCSNLRSYFKEI